MRPLLIHGFNKEGNMKQNLLLIIGAVFLFTMQDSFSAAR